MPIKKKKISELPLAASLAGLFTIGVDTANRSVKVSLEWLRTAYENVTDILAEALSAATAAGSAAVAASGAAASASSAATKATTAADDAHSAASAVTREWGLLSPVVQKAITDAEAATASAKDTAAHPTYIGTDYYVHVWNSTDGVYGKTDIYVKGETGKTPVIQNGTTEHVSGDTPAGVSLIPDGTDENGNPVYILHAQIPEGLQGRPLIVMPNGNFGHWDFDAGDYVDSGIPASATVDLQGTPVYFEADPAEERSNIDDGETVPVAFGKIKRFFSDFGSLVWKSAVDFETEVTGKDSIPAAYVAPAVGAHDTASGSHADIRSEIGRVEAIARGKVRARVFATMDDLDAWLTDPANVSQLEIGDNFYIRATDTPDCWWDGAQKQPLEGEKVILPEPLVRQTALAVGDWVTSEDPAMGAYRCTVSDPEITDGADVEYWPGDKDSAAAYSDANVYPYAAAAVGSFILYAENLPQANINLKYRISWL